MEAVDFVIARPPACRQAEWPWQSPEINWLREIASPFGLAMTSQLIFINSLT